MMSYPCWKYILSLIRKAENNTMSFIENRYYFWLARQTMTSLIGRSYNNVYLCLEQIVSLSHLTMTSYPYWEEILSLIGTPDSDVISLLRTDIVSVWYARQWCHILVESRYCLWLAYHSMTSYTCWEQILSLIGAPDDDLLEEILFFCSSYFP